MSYRFKPHRESVQKGLTRIAVEQLTRGINTCVTAELSVHERVHQVRKRCKKLRALLRLVRPSIGEKTYKNENVALRDAARTIAYPRDVYVMRRTYDALVDSCDLEVNRQKLAPIARELTEEIDALVERDLAQRVERLVDPLRAVMERAEQWELDEKGFNTLASGLQKCYARARAAMKDAYDKPSPERFHEFRKRAKYHRYHARLLRSLWPAQMDLREAELHRLTDALGEDHDLSVMHGWLKDEQPCSEDARALLRGLILERRESCQKQAKLLAHRLFCEPPKAHKKHMRQLAQASW